MEPVPSCCFCWGEGKREEVASRRQCDRLLSTKTCKYANKIALIDGNINASIIITRFKMHYMRKGKKRKRAPFLRRSSAFIFGL